MFFSVAFLLVCFSRCASAQRSSYYKIIQKCSPAIVSENKLVISTKREFGVYKFLYANKRERNESIPFRPIYTQKCHHIQQYHKSYWIQQQFFSGWQPHSEAENRSTHPLPILEKNCCWIQYDNSIAEYDDNSFCMSPLHSLLATSVRLRENNSKQFIYSEFSLCWHY
jgi:hypothetical protein